MDQIGFLQFMPDLDFFSRLPPNTDVHVARNGHFVVNGGNYGSVMGVQTIVNVYNEYTPEKMAQELTAFADSLVHSLEALHSNAETSGCPNVRFKVFTELSSANVAIKKAIEGCDPNGGMQGLLKTYPTGSVHDALATAISKIQFFSNLWLFSAKQKNWNPIPLNEVDGLPLCREAFFNHQDWEREMAIGTSLRKESIGFLKYYGNYSSALALTQSMVTSGAWNWWDKIVTFPHGPSLFLGALPMKRGAARVEWRNDLEMLKQAGVQAVLSVVEVFENNSEGLLTSPIFPTEWHAADIKQLQLPTPDFETIDLNSIQCGVEFIHWNIKHGRSVYCHCKAGRGRSALILACYLIKYHGHTSESALALIRAQRTQAGFSATSTKMATLKDFERRFNGTSGLS